MPRLNALLLMLCASTCHAQPLLHPVFQDHAVLQREQAIRVWGWAEPGTRVQVSLGGSSADTQADPTGRWTATLPAMDAGGPYELVVRASTGVTHTIRDVLIGDVWLCSGQSNMALQVRYALNATSEIAGATDDTIRMLTIAQSSSHTPLESFDRPLRWLPASPQTVGDFSATCFYFARELKKTVDVPMGLVNASWGGSKIQAWMSAQTLRRVGGYAVAVTLLERYRSDPLAALDSWNTFWQGWWRARAPADAPTPWSADAVEGPNWLPVPRELDVWEKWGDPALATFNGMVWYRTSVRLSAEQAKQGGVLSLGPIDEVDHTWINGRLVGATSGHEVERKYEVPAGWLRAGENAIAVSVLDTYGSGGIYGPPEKRALRLSDGTLVPLDGKWSYYVVPASVGLPPRAPWDVLAGVTTIYNAMVAPLRGFGIRGVVWYQGESNTDEPKSYRKLLQGLMADWREQFGAGLPFLVVQLANFGPPARAPGESGWAEVREAQRLAVASDPHAGLAVAIDIGDRYDLHPPNKQEVGRRLARAARHVVYGEAIAPSGPTPLAAGRESGGIVVTFRDVEGRLVTYGSDVPIGFELCGDGPDSCHYAQAVLKNDHVVLSAANVSEATRVRFCWADSPVCNLYDESGLPAGPFELAIR